VLLPEDKPIEPHLLGCKNRNVMDNSIHIEHTKFTLRHFLTTLLSVIAINTLIAFVLTAIGFGWGLVPVFITSQCIGISIYLCSYAAAPIYRKTKNLSMQIFVIAAFVVVGAVSGTLLGAFANGIAPILFLREHSVFFSQVLLIGLLFGAIVSYVFISMEVFTREKVKRLEIEKSMAETELKLLQSQMEPHFLFNTLSNVIGLIDTDRDRARRMLESFSSFLRGSFLTARERTVTLSQELDVIRNYLDIFVVRMGDRLDYVIDVPENIRDCRIPPLLIQPLVENALKHGLEPSVRGGAVTIEGIRDGNSIRIIVSDSGVGINEKSSGKGIGLTNIRKRLELLYGSRGRLGFEENKQGGIKAIIEIPYETGSGDHS
jgi:sensor histidine kinase YesM